MSAIRTVVVGGGIMGGGIAVALARAGHAVAVVEPDATAAAALTSRVQELAGDAPEGTPRVVSGWEPVMTAHFVIEAAPEDLALKEDVWARLGALAPLDALLASNTSSLDIDALAALVPRPERVLATHWFNPAYEVECVEVAPGRATDPDVVGRALTILRDAGKHAVVVRNGAGFVANRIQFAAIREALLCLEEGMPAESIDEVVSTSFAPRLAALGPLANADLGGLDTYLAIFEVLRSAHGDRFAPPRILADLVADGRHGVKTGAGVFDYTPAAARALVERRDERLSRIIAATRDRGGTA
ncbi:MAG: 3-hydroxyacyl-CoA dehydrogenase family protein [Microbacterium sp.]|uniref:3-hydroxyacyl-CoA dehydrogenase family protein n=1 Tax=Microbacterium sp. TaxID=51671 RepID=UPI001ACF696F|nr:3-hydroxyacyl-CoA dehydrogenase family protein [Microbacterium sp.]MBN9153519.1 3-hydroxyacyl-CoA dehydrogenase family protein [Microbacterium sp.]